MTPSTALARVIVEEMLRGGVREAVLAPGSRNAPLAFALHEADRAGTLRLHVRIDERTAGFLALGLAKASGRPVPVVTTSGTAAVNMHPAVVEADYSGVPVVVLTADRPAELRGVGANQSIDQTRLYGGSVRLCVELSTDAEPTAGGQRAAISRALAAACDGPVHLNVALREPLVPDPGDSWPAPPAADPGPVLGPTISAQRPPPLTGGVRTVVVAGDRAGAGARRLAERAGWPLLAEPSSGARGGDNAIGTYRLLLGHLGPDIRRVVVAGRPTLSRAVTGLLARDDVELVRLAQGSAGPEVHGEPDEEWLDSWTAADKQARDAVDHLLAGEPPTGPSVARTVATAVDASGLLVAGSSSPIRDLDLADPWAEPPLVLANRGASGIDGTVSTAIGAALAHAGPAYALLGDLTFLHDSTGLVLGPAEPRPGLTIVVVNDNGGGLFTLLEQGAAEHAHVFERLFGTPHGVDLASLCAATGTAYVRADSLDDLRRELRPVEGVRVIEVRTDRGRTRGLHERLAAAVQDSLR